MPETRRSIRLSDAGLSAMDEDTNPRSPSKKKTRIAVESSEDEIEKPSSFPGRKLFHKLWSIEDEVEILKGMSGFPKALLTSEDFTILYDLVRKSLQVDVSRKQLKDKIRRLKNRYENNASKLEKGGELKFSGPVELLSYELSKKVWGQRDVNEEQREVDGAIGLASISDELGEKGLDQERKETGDVSELHPSIIGEKNNDKVRNEENGERGSLKHQVFAENRESVFGFLYDRFSESFCGKNPIQPCLNQNLLKRVLGLTDSVKARELKEKWKKIQIDELKIFIQRIDLVKEQAELMLEALISSDM